jgi:NAD(P)-dependent dehydrogenase (short-subunit alcohol dehydrogenase family)
MDRTSSRELDGQVAVVTGGTAGIGLSTAARLARAGAQVVVCSRSAKRVLEATDTLRSQGFDVTGIEADVRDASSVTALFDFAVKTYGGIDILVNNAGGSYSDSFKRAPLMELTAVDLIEAFRLNAVASLLCCQSAVPLMRSRGGGSVVNVSSIAAYGAAGSFGAYGAAKSALNTLTRTLAEEVSPEIRVNAVAAGSILTPRTAKDHSKSVGRIMLERLGSPEDVAELIYFLSSPASSWITGTVTMIDGGRRIGQPRVLFRTLIFAAFRT